MRLFIGSSASLERLKAIPGNVRSYDTSVDTVHAVGTSLPIVDPKLEDGAIDSLLSTKHEVLHTKRIVFKNKFNMRKGVGQFDCNTAFKPYRSISAHFIKEKTSTKTSPILKSEKAFTDMICVTSNILTRKLSFRKPLSEKKQQSERKCPHLTESSIGESPPFQKSSRLMITRENIFPWNTRDKYLERFSDRNKSTYLAFEDQEKPPPLLNQKLMSDFVEHKIKQTFRKNLRDSISKDLPIKLKFISNTAVRNMFGKSINSRLKR